MKTQFPYQGKIDFNSYFNKYMEGENAIRTLPSQAESAELARKAIVKDHLVLLPIPAGETAEPGDTVTMATVSDIPKFNKPRVTASLGRGLYNRDLEEMAVGKKVGDSFALTIQGKDVSVTILEIRRKAAPEPTDEMVAALGAKDNGDKLITTVEDYVKFIVEEKMMTTLAEINYYVVGAIIDAYPMTDYDESDIRALGELEKAFFIKLFLEREGIDLREDIPQSWKEDMHINTLDEFITSRYEWYKMKIQQCLIFQNILGIPCQGKNDPLDHYEVLSELQLKMFDYIKEKMGG